MPSSSASIFTPLVPNPCTQPWEGPAANNSFDHCFSGDGAADVWLNWFLDNALWQFAVPFAIGFIVLIPFSCIVLCGRYLCNCCGSSKMRPLTCCGCSKADVELDEYSDDYKVRLYSKSGVIATKLFAFIVALVGVAGIALCVLGGVKLVLGLEEVLSATSDLLVWVIGIIDVIRADIQDENGTYPSGFTGGVYDDFVSEVYSIRDTYVDQTFVSHKVAIYCGLLVPAFFSVVPGVIIMLPAFAAITNTRKNLPAVTIFLSFPCQFLFFLVVTLLLIVLVPVDMLCADLNASPSDRSMTQWYLIPMCEDQSPFADIKANVGSMEAEAGAEACVALAAVCSNSTVYSMATVAEAKQVFSCALVPTGDPSLASSYADQCATVEALSAVVDSLRLKPDGAANPETCGGLGANCSLSDCAESCDASEVRSSAADTLASLRTAQRIKSTYATTLLPWLDCNALFVKVRSLGPQQVCSTLQGGLSFFKDGAIVIAAGMVVAMIVALLGQKRFVDYDKYTKAKDGFGSDVDDYELGDFSENPSGVGISGVGNGSTVRGSTTFSGSVLSASRNPLTASSRGAPPPPLPGYVTIGAAPSSPQHQPQQHLVNNSNKNSNPQPVSLHHNYNYNNNSSNNNNSMNDSVRIDRAATNTNNNNNSLSWSTRAARMPWPSPNNNSNNTVTNTHQSNTNVSNYNRRLSSSVGGGGGQQQQQSNNTVLSSSVRNGHAHAAAAAAAAERLMANGRGGGEETTKVGTAATVASTTTTTTTTAISSPPLVAVGRTAEAEVRVEAMETSPLPSLPFVAVDVSGRSALGKDDIKYEQKVEQSPSPKKENAFLHVTSSKSLSAPTATKKYSPLAPLVSGPSTSLAQVGSSSPSSSPPTHMLGLPPRPPAHSPPLVGGQEHMRPLIEETQPLRPNTQCNEDENTDDAAAADVAHNSAVVRVPFSGTMRDGEDSHDPPVPKASVTEEGTNECIHHRQLQQQLVEREGHHHHHHRGGDNGDDTTNDSIAGLFEEEAEKVGSDSEDSAEAPLHFGNE